MIHFSASSTNEITFFFTIGMPDYARWARWQSSFMKLNQPPLCFVALIVIKLSLHMYHRFVIVGFGCVVALWASTTPFSSSFLIFPCPYEGIVFFNLPFNRVLTYSHLQTEMDCSCLDSVKHNCRCWMVFVWWLHNWWLLQELKYYISSRSLINLCLICCLKF